MDGFNIPVTIDGLTVLAAVIALLGIAAFISGVVGLFSRRGFRFSRFGGSVVLLILGVLVFAVAGWAQTYRTLTHNELVATIRAVPVPNKPQTMTVTYTPITSGVPGTPQTYTIIGDRWQLRGDIIKWQDYVNILGVNTGYRINRLMGYFNDVNDYRTKRVSAFNLYSGSDTVGQFLRDHANLMPFVRATYGNAVDMAPDPTGTYKIYVSTSGYWTVQ
jgi:hypothetical protein